MIAGDINPEEADRIRSYAVEVLKVFGSEFDAAASRFSGSRLLRRFDDAISAMLSNGRALISSVDEAHNELWIASLLIANPNPRFTLLEYEPALTGRGKSIDFRGATDRGPTVFVDVKTIMPKPKDRWDQFQKAVSEGWIPDNIRVHLSREGRGGELWHSMFTARARILECPWA
jgi:hypothetical protein